MNSTSNARNRSRRFSRGGHMIAIGLLTLSVVAVFHNAIVTDEVFAFRDAAHFYYPLFQWTTEQWKAGEIPLWNPLEDLGAPVVADATSSVFYPGKILFLLPGEFGAWYKAYIILHVWLCGLSSYWIARHWKLGASAATFAAASYALSGNVLFQYCNVVYLVGAAWLPFAIRSGDQLLSEKKLRSRLAFRRVLTLAFCLAMMVLGGDAQMAYHTGMMLAGYAWLKRKLPHAGFGGYRLVLRLLLAASITFGLAAVQSIPSANWLQQSTRASYDIPRNIYEFIGGHSMVSFRDGSFRDGFGQTLLGQTEPGHHSNAYDFSVGPWRFMELLWPNVGGKMFPENQRWMNAIPAEGRVWTPTLYMGLLPILLASLSVRLRRGTVKRRFLSWCALFAIVAALGRYGAGWLLKELSYDFAGGGADGKELAIGNPFGGLYWFFTVTLPGYAYFRYPAKLWVIATLAMSQLAGMSFHNLSQLHNRVLKRLVIVAVVTLCCGLIGLLIPFGSITLLTEASVSVPFGPLDVASIKPQIAVTALHTVFLAGLLAGLLKLHRSATIPAATWLLVILTAGELTLAHQWLIPTASWKAMNNATQPILRHELTNHPPLRVFRRLPRTYPYYAEGSKDRFEQLLWWNSQTAYPKNHLLRGVGLVGSRHSLDSAYLSALLKAFTTEAKPTDLRLSYMEALGISGTVNNRIRSDKEKETVAWYASYDARRAWIVHNIHWQLAPDTQQATEFARYTQASVQSGRTARDSYEHNAVVDARNAPEIPTGMFGDYWKPNHDDATIVAYENQSVKLKARLSKPGLVVLNDTYTDGWKAYVPGANGGPSVRVPILRTNGVMRGVYLPAGRFTIEMRYEPSDLYLGAWLSGVTWSLSLLYLVVHFGLQIVRRIRSHA